MLTPNPRKAIFHRKGNLRLAPAIQVKTKKPDCTVAAISVAASRNPADLEKSEEVNQAP